MTCIPQLCSKPSLATGQVVIEGCAGTPGLNNDNSMGKTCLLGCGSGYRNLTPSTIGICRPVQGRPSVAYQWPSRPLECEPVNLCTDNNFAVNSLKDFCHVNSTCTASSIPGSARCICNAGFTGLVMEVNVTYSIATRTNMIAQMNPSVAPKRHCMLISCPAHSAGAGGGSKCVCVGSYSGTIVWSKESNMYLGRCSKCDSTQGSVPDPSGTMCFCMAGWTWTGVRCSRCPIGTFKAEISNDACYSCEYTAAGPGSTTYDVGSTSQRDCICNDGHFNVSRGRIKCEHEITSGMSDASSLSVSSKFECQRCPSCALCLKK